MDERVRIRLKTLFQLFASFKPSLQPDLLWQVFVVADLEAATLVGRRSEECRLDSPPALGGAALGRADGQRGGGRLEPARRGASLPAPEADPADPGSLRCAACGCHRRVPEAAPLLALPPSTAAAAAARRAPWRGGAQGPPGGRAEGR